MTQIRIGDAERDAAAGALGEHYAAGRLTKTEYDERVDQVWTARFEQDLQPLFTDLPRGPREVAPRADRPEQSVPGQRPAPPAWAAPRPWPTMLFAPIAVIGLIVAVILTGAPWLLFALFWLWVFTGFGHHRRSGRRSGRRHWHQPVHNYNGWTR